MATKMECVSLAVGAQLGAEGKRAEDWTSVFGSDLKYDIFTIQLYLVRVEQRLIEGEPRYKFTWDDALAAKALERSIMDLIGDISAASTPVSEHAPA